MRGVPSRYSRRRGSPTPATTANRYPLAPHHPRQPGHVKRPEEARLVRRGAVHRVPIAIRRAAAVGGRPVQRTGQRRKQRPGRVEDCAAYSALQVVHSCVILSCSQEERSSHSAFHARPPRRAFRTWPAAGAGHRQRHPTAASTADHEYSTAGAPERQVHQAVRRHQSQPHRRRTAPAGTPKDRRLNAGARAVATAAAIRPHPPPQLGQELDGVVVHIGVAGFRNDRAPIRARIERDEVAEPPTSGPKPGVIAPHGQSGACHRQPLARRPSPHPAPSAPRRMPLPAHAAQPGNIPGKARPRLRPPGFRRLTGRRNGPRIAGHIHAPEASPGPCQHDGRPA